MFRGYTGACGVPSAVQQPDTPDLPTAVPRLHEGLRAAGHDTDAGTLEQLLSDNDEPLLRWLDETSEQLAPVLIAAEHLLDPQAFVLGGILPSPLANALLERLVVLTKELHGPAKVYAPEFLRGISGDDALTVAAATLPLYRALSPDALAGGGS